MKVAAIRFAPEEKEWIGSFASLNGKSFSAQVREWTLERLEDELDALDLKEAIINDDGTSYSWDEVKKELGL
jgi:predicted DNA-binding protein